MITAGIISSVWGNEVEKISEITTETTVITRTVVKEKTQWSRFKVCVLDFTSLDIMGQKRFLSEKNLPIVIPTQATLNNDDRESVDGIMQGFVKMIDAFDTSTTNDANRDAQTDDNEFSRAKALDLYHTVVKGESRPMIIGAEYLAAYLGRHNDVFACVEPALMSAAMNKLQNSADFPKDFMLKLARETGATHLIYGTVSDIRTKSNSFKGYGIETKTTNYQLDVIIKMVDLAAQQTVYSNVYTGNYREQRPISGTQFDNNIFQNLMTSALEQAAEDLYDKCRPGRKNQITVTPLPYRLTVIPQGGVFLKPEKIEVSLDGTLIGKGSVSVMVPAGKHTLTLSAAGAAPRDIEIDVTKDQVIKASIVK